MRVSPTVVVLVAIATPARADDAAATRIHDTSQPSDHDGSACQDMPHDCAVATSVAVRGGRVNVYVAHDTRTQATTPAVLARGEYRVMYGLELPVDARVVITETFEDGGQPNAHHYEICKSSSDWCEQIETTTPRLSVDRRGVVTFVMTTVTREQRWTADAPSRTMIVRHAYARTIRCTRGGPDEWSCTTTYGGRTI